MKHADEFLTKGISSEEVPELLINALSNEEITGMQGTRPIYEIIFKGKVPMAAITTGKNGFLAGVNPLSIS